MTASNHILLCPVSLRERGVSIPSICEADIGDIVCRAMSETLEEFGVRHSRHWEKVDAGVGELALDFAIGYHSKQKSFNESVVEYGAAGDLAELLAETLSEWGRCCSFGHQVKTPKGGYTLGRIRLSLFVVNGPDADQYLCRLTDLGRQMAQTIADHAKGSTATPASALSSDSTLLASSTD